MNVPMLVAQGQTMPHYHQATVSQVVTMVTYVSYPFQAASAFCAADLYRVYFSPASYLDFCFVPLSASQCPTGNCPTAPFVNYAHFVYDPQLLALPCVAHAPLGTRGAHLAASC